MTIQEKDRGVRQKVEGRKEQSNCRGLEENEPHYLNWPKIQKL